MQRKFLGRCSKISKMRLIHFLSVSMLSTKTTELSFFFVTTFKLMIIIINKNQTTNLHKIPILFLPSKYVTHDEFLSVNYMGTNCNKFNIFRSWPLEMVQLGSDWLYNRIKIHSKFHFSSLGSVNVRNKPIQKKSFKFAKIRRGRDSSFEWTKHVVFIPFCFNIHTYNHALFREWKKGKFDCETHAQINGGRGCRRIN